MSEWLKRLVDEVTFQRSQYSALRGMAPGRFGNALNGCMDGTPEIGPYPLICWAPGYSQGWLLWHVHKWPWPMDYWYCFGKAWDSRGERTDERYMLDVRDLPEHYRGRLKIDAKTRRIKNHRIIIGRALADGYDLPAHTARVGAEALAKAAARRAEREQREATGSCTTCGTAPAEVYGECEPCFGIPF